MRARMLAGVAVVLLLAADEAAKKEFDKLQGTWDSTAAQVDGRDLAADGVKVRLVFKDKSLAIEGSEDVQRDYSKASVDLNPAANPKRIDLGITAGDRKDAKLLGIYELKEDTLWLCVKPSGNERPDKLAAPEGSEAALVVLKRVKP
jgi:uncharacterized protein (TIGR03067 family)